MQQQPKGLLQSKASSEDDGEEKTAMREWSRKEVRSSLGATRAYNGSLCAAARLEEAVEEEPNCTKVDRPSMKSNEDIRAA
ncbi:unnamed protein product [Arctogadus glacialis]